MCLFIHSVKRWKINFISLYPKYAVKKYSIYLFFSLFILLINILFIVKFPHANAESLRNISYKPMKRSEKECLLLCQCLIGIMILKYLMRCNVFVFLKKGGTITWSCYISDMPQWGWMFFTCLTVNFWFELTVLSLIFLVHVNHSILYNFKIKINVFILCWITALKTLKG